MSATAAILDFASADHVLSDNVRGHAERLLTDTLAGGAAGVASPEAQELWSAVQGWGDGDDARLLGIPRPIRPELVEGPQERAVRTSTGSARTELRLSAPSAAFFNGFAIHCLEWDAVHEPAVVHALSVVTAALLAASDRAGGSDEDEFLTALAVGVDIASGIGLSATGAMCFFRPATAGIVGAALAVARLYGVHRDRYDDVLGLAYSFASGTMQAHVEASIALPLQIGNAARSAITAVDLARAGMDGPNDALEGPFGYSALIEEIDLARYTNDLGQIWRIAEVSVKPYPSGRASHGALGALAQIREERGLGLVDVESIELFAPPLIHRLVGRPLKSDMSPAYARLCFPLLAPLMLRDGHIDPRHFDSTGLSDTALAELGARVRVTLDGNEDGNAMAPQRLVILLKSGEVIERQIDANLGSPDAPMSDEQYAQKYDLCRTLAGEHCDPRIFDAPLSYATEPR